MPDKNRERMELCLCQKCASAFYAIPTNKVIRKDPYQTDRDLCTFCNSRLGYDFLIFKKRNVQKPVKHRIRTLEREAENEYHVG